MSAIENLILDTIMTTRLKTSPARGKTKTEFDDCFEMQFPDRLFLDRIAAIGKARSVKFAMTVGGRHAAKPAGDFSP